MDANRNRSVSEFKTLIPCKTINILNETDADIHSILATDRLNQQAWKMRVNDSNQALVLSKEALELSENTGYIKGKAEALTEFHGNII